MACRGNFDPQPDISGVQNYGCLHALFCRCGRVMLLDRLASDDVLDVACARLVHLRSSDLCLD